MNISKNKCVNTKQLKTEEFLKLLSAGRLYRLIMGSLVENKPKFAEIAGVSRSNQIYCVEAVTRLLPMFNEKTMVCNY